MLTTSFDPAFLRTLRLDLGQSVRTFALTLKRAIDPQAEHGYSHVYVLQLEQGQRQLTDELARAYARIAAAADDADPALAAAREVTVMAADPAAAGALVAGEVRACARPGCPVRFVAAHPNQRYHSPYCRGQARRR